MASAGIIPGMITCAFSGAVCGFGLYLLTRCAPATPHRRSSFFAVSQLTFPQAAVLFDAAVAIKCFGVSVRYVLTRNGREGTLSHRFLISYLIIIKSLMPNVVASIFHDLTSPDTNPPEWALSGRNWVILVMVLLAPLSFLRKLDSLRYASYVAMFSVVYLVIIVITCYFRPLEGVPPVGEIHWIHFKPGFVATLPVQIFSFTCAQNIFPIYNELRTNSQQRLNTIVGTSIGGTVIIYEVIAIFGYLTFGSNVGANIIAMYPPTSLFIAVGQLAIVTLITFSYCLQVQPCRNCLDKIFNGKALVKRAEEGELDEHVGGDMTVLKHVLLTGAILLSGFIIAYNMDDLELVLSFVGSTGSTTVSFILPGLLFWKVRSSHAVFLVGVALTSCTAHQGRPECESAAEQECAGAGGLRMLCLRLLVRGALRRAVTLLTAVTQLRIQHLPSCIPIVEQRTIALIYRPCTYIFRVETRVMILGFDGTAWLQRFPREGGGKWTICELFDSFPPRPTDASTLALDRSFSTTTSGTSLGQSRTRISPIDISASPTVPLGRAPAKLITMLSSTIIPTTATSNTSNPDLQTPLFHLPLPPDPANLYSPSRSDSEPLADSDSIGSALSDVDPQIVEALKSKDRIYVLKLGEQMESLINDRRFVFSPFVSRCGSRTVGLPFHAHSLHTIHTLTAPTLQASH
ncbi:transmembrane amino acid transporter protein-domain-containing protein [Boletus reticuloceps]|uniref:Transmembrane amino acid transporter protein-domain-containing protein n=1 Tax=Boletus reticuloceps TaxID=495285 RepID=A0A8I3ADM3_9AGAM|nr:transmembrane amino acid transporter protein-domain-containing protein [Boletus reticuloceps]